MGWHSEKVTIYENEAYDLLDSNIASEHIVYNCLPLQNKLKPLHKKNVPFSVHSERHWGERVKKGCIDFSLVPKVSPYLFFTPTILYFYPSQLIIVFCFYFPITCPSRFNLISITPYLQNLCVYNAKFHCILVHRLITIHCRYLLSIGHRTHPPPLVHRLLCPAMK